MDCSWSDWDKKVSLESMNGETIKSIEGLDKYSDEVIFTMDSGKKIVFTHIQDCCESVNLEDFEHDGIDGGLIISAEEVDGVIPDKSERDYWDDSQTWTFYKIETNRGGLWMRWLGESNGYYSESVDILWVNKPVD